LGNALSIKFKYKWFYFKFFEVPKYNFGLYVKKLLLKGKIFFIEVKVLSMLRSQGNSNVLFIK